MKRFVGYTAWSIQPTRTVRRSVFIRRNELTAKYPNNNYASKQSEEEDLLPQVRHAQVGLAMNLKQIKYDRKSSDIDVVHSKRYPTSPFTILGLQIPSNDVSELHNFCRSPYCEALELWKGRSGRTYSNMRICPRLDNVEFCSNEKIVGKYHCDSKLGKHLLVLL